MSALKPCPFCGERADFVRRGTPRQSCIVACETCGATHESTDEGNRSGDWWNRRAPVEITDEMVKAALAATHEAWLDGHGPAKRMRAALRAALGVAK